MIRKIDQNDRDHPHYVNFMTLVHKILINQALNFVTPLMDFINENVNLIEQSIIFVLQDSQHGFQNP